MPEQDAPTSDGYGWGDYSDAWVEECVSVQATAESKSEASTDPFLEDWEEAMTAVRSMARRVAEEEWSNGNNDARRRKRGGSLAVPF
eukprot:99123-Rhodomonas_salina.1